MAEEKAHCAECGRIHARLIAERDLNEIVDALYGRLGETERRVGELENMSHVHAEARMVPEDGDIPTPVRIPLEDMPSND